MAINWTPKMAIKAIKENDKDGISDIGKRFPLALAGLVLAAENEGACTILSAIPKSITVRKIEAILKDGVDESDSEDTEVEEKTEEKPKTSRGRKPKAKAEKEVDEDDEDDEDPVALYKQCKKAGLKVKPKQTADYYKKQLAALDESDDDDEDDDWGDEEEDEAPKKTSKKEEPEDDEDDDWDI